MKKIKVTAFLNAYSQGKSGADVIFVEIYKRLKNIDLTIVTSKLGSDFCKRNNLKASYIITTTEKQFDNIILTYLKRIFFGLTAKIDSTDLIYTTSDSLADVLPAFYHSVTHRKPLIGNIFHLIPSNRFLSYITQKISLQLFKWRKAQCFVDNEILMNKLLKYGFNKNSLILRYPGINFSYLSKIKPLRKYTATSMIRIHPSKGIFDLIKIWKLVVKFKPNATLGIIGTGNKMYIAELNKRIITNNLNKNITLLGYVNDSYAYQLIKGSEIFLFPSHEEGFGMAVGEALALQKNVVAYDLPVFAKTFKKLINSVPCFNINIFSEKIVTILKNKNLSTINTQKLIKFSWENVINREKKVIYEAIH